MVQKEGVIKLKGRWVLFVKAAKVMQTELLYGSDC